MKIKTTELTGKALDWAVGVAVGERISVVEVSPRGANIYIDGSMCQYSPTTNWSQLGPLLASHLHGLNQTGTHTWTAHTYHSTTAAKVFGVGDTPLIAACRAIVAARLGDTVDVPEVFV